MGKGVKPGLGHGGIICVLQTQFPPTSDSSRGAVGGRQKDGHLVLVSGLEAYKSGSSVVRGTNRLQNDLNCVDGDVKPQQNKQIIVK